MSATAQADKPHRTNGASLLALALAAALMALAGLGIWHFERTLNWNGLDWPTQTVRHEPEALAAGLDAYAARNRSPNHHHILIKANGGDIDRWLAHLDNIAAHKGWYTTSKGRISRNLIVPGREVSLLWDAKDDPYRWLEEHRPPPNAQAKPLALGQYPGYVHFRVEQKVPVSSALLFIGSVITAATGLFIAILNVKNTRKKTR